MPKGHPRCPDCHGAGGRMARKVGGQTRWVRCKCVPNHIDDNSRLQAKAHVKQLAERDNSTSLGIAVEVAMFCGITEEQLTEYLMDHMTAHAWADADRARAVISDTYSQKDKENADT